MTFFFEGKNVLITGAGGFGGSHLTKFLVDKGANVTVLVRDKNKLVNLEGYIDKIKIMEGDVRDENTVQKAVKGNEIIYHFATFFGSGVKGVLGAVKEPGTTFEVNVLGTVNVAKKAISENVSRMIFISTSHVYGEQPPNLLPIKETVPPNPTDIVGMSKYAAELSLRYFMDDIEIIITRAFNQIGEGHMGDYFVPKVITNFLKEVKPVLWSPHTTRDYSYVSDIVEGYALVGNKGRKGEIYNLSSGKETSMGEMLKMIANAFGVKEIEVEWRSTRPHDFSRSRGDSSKAIKELGWQPKVPLEEGIKRTIEWWKKHPELWDLTGS